MSFRGCLVSLALLATAVCGAVVPAGTDLQIRLKTKVATKTSKAKDPVEAMLIQPVVADGKLVIAGGTLVRGRIAEVKPVAKEGDRAEILLDFTEMVGAGGRAVKIVAKIQGVDNARESVDDSGKINGILGTETLSSRMDSGIAKVAQRYQFLGDLLNAAKGAVIKESDPEIDYEPGVEMTLRLTKELKWDYKTARPVVTPVPNEPRLAALVHGQPFRTEASSPPKPSDMTNLMFIGSRQQLDAAFAAAGWASAASLNRDSELETFRAIAEQRGYKEAPMSILLLDGQKPDITFQKQNNTFAKRHHLRIWLRPVMFEGKPVWVCAATHDVGISFSAENRTFIHRVDHNIDAERAKVVSDLLLSGHVAGLSLVERPEAPKTIQNATGDDLNTDGAMAVLLLQ